MICSFVEHGDPPLGFVLLARTWVLSLFLLFFSPLRGVLCLMKVYDAFIPSKTLKELFSYLKKRIFTSQILQYFYEYKNQKEIQILIP